MAKNGGYQIIDFNGQAPATMDVTFVESCLNRGKPVWINNLVVNGETYCGVGNIKKTTKNISIIIDDMHLTIDSDGTIFYERLSIATISINDSVHETQTNVTITIPCYLDLNKLVNDYSLDLEDVLQYNDYEISGLIESTDMSKQGFPTNVIFDFGNQTCTIYGYYLDGTSATLTNCDYSVTYAPVLNGKYIKN